MQQVRCTGSTGSRRPRPLAPLRPADDLRHRPLQGPQELPLGLFHAGLDVPLPDVADQGLDRVVQPASQQAGGEGLDLDGNVGVDALAQALLAVALVVDVAGVDVVGGELPGPDVVGGDGDLLEVQVDFAVAVAVHALDDRAGDASAGRVPVPTEDHGDGFA